jgi:hypothetical protein
MRKTLNLDRPRVIELNPTTPAELRPLPLTARPVSWANETSSKWPFVELTRYYINVVTLLPKKKGQPRNNEVDYGQPFWESLGAIDWEIMNLLSHLGLIKTGFQ